MKRIYRLSDDKKIAGICGGIADMFNFDPTLVRLAAVFLAVITSIVPGIVTYAVGWFLIPEMTRDEARQAKEDAARNQ